MPLFRWLAGSYALGLSLAVGVTIALSAWLFDGAESHQRVQFEHRLVQVQANALAGALASASHDDFGRLIEEWKARSPGHESAVLISGMELLGSTKPEDAAPRRLVREEKPLFDLANLIRSARDTNISEGVVRKKLVDIEKGVTAAYVVTVPYLSKGEFAGILQIRIRDHYGDSHAEAGHGGSLLWLTLLLAACVLGALLRPRSEARLDIPRVAALAAFLGLTLFYQSQRMDAHVEGDLEGNSRVAAAVQDAVSHYGIPATGAAAASPWDTDQYLRPLGIVLGDGRIAEGTRLTQFAEQARFFERSLWAVEALGLGLMLAFVFGYMRWLAVTLRTHADAYAYVAPAMIGMLVLVFFPFLYGITLAFTDTTLFNEALPFSERWIGWDNFVTILGDFNLYERSGERLIWNYQNFYWTLMVTIIWTVTNVTIGVSVGFILALILNIEDLKGRAIYRVILILPWAIPNYITALVWRGMFHPQFGVINQVLQMLGMAPVAWFDGVVSSFLTGLATNGWLSFPFMMVVILGALQSIPKDMYEAAEVEGATRWQRLRHITLPLLRPTLIPAIVLSVVWTFNMFNIIFLVSGGEPAGANEILITKAYKIAFENYQYAYAAAYSTVIFIILLIYGVFQTRITKATESF
jgi:arabinogalactan oligomer/maltooligosaccharide transport system permease protein